MTTNRELTEDDIGKTVLFSDDNVVYEGRITGVENGYLFNVEGDALPAINAVLLNLLICDKTQSRLDLKFKPQWDSEIRQRMIELALKDTTRNAAS